MAVSVLEEGFARLWTMLKPGLPAPEREWRFSPPRRWRFDFAWPDRKVAVEVEGSARGGGRHQRRAGFQADAEKYNAAAELGWVVLRYTGDDLRKRPAQCIEQVARVLQRCRIEQVALTLQQRL